MRVVIVAYGEDPTLALREATDVSNILQATGHSVYLIAGPDATLEALGDALDHGPFDLAWIITHSGADGFQLADQTITPAQLGQWLAAAHCWEAFLNSCFSAEHVIAIQRAATVDVVATIDPAGVDGRLAHSTGTYLARALASTGDLQDACEQASGRGSVQYRWFPAGTGLRQAGGSDSDLARQVQDLVRSLTGDLSGNPGLIYKLDRLSQQLERYVADDRIWKEETTKRMRSLEGSRRLNAFGLVMMLMITAALLALTLSNVPH